MNDRTSSAGFIRLDSLRYNRSGFETPREWRGEASDTPGAAGSPKGISLPHPGALDRIAPQLRKRGTMRTRPVVILLLAVVFAAATAWSGVFAGPLAAQDQGQNPDSNQDQGQYTDQGFEEYEYQNFSADQLDNLLAPIALYPDPLLAQVLVAATFPDQVDDAARFLRAGADPNQIDDQSWDVSVKSVAHYPTVLYMMDNRLDWTTSIGQAYVNQSTDVQASVQRLRAMAYNAGTLASGPQIQVVQDGPYWQIWPANPQFIYVPVYNPEFVFYGRPGWRGPYITFGVGSPIGCWLNLGFNWGGPGIYYFGWGGVLPGWAVRSRPYVRVTRFYVNERYRTVNVNRNVVHRSVNYENLKRYNRVHREVTYTNVRQRRFEGTGPRPTPPNQIVQRNIDTRDSRIQDFRGRENQGGGETTQRPGTPAPPERMRPEQSRPAQQRPEQARPEAQRPEQARPEAQRPAPQRPRQVPPEARSNERPSAFSSEGGAFNPRQASQRGQSSRQEMKRSEPAPKSAPAGRSSGGRRKP